ncbi:MAG: hydroxymyristoyl-ACP dehydratase [Leeuwenhoekiella sp.]
MTPETIIQLLPYDKPFLFVDGIESVSATQIQGYYTFREDLFFYKGHFKNKPVTPGVILIECMAQIGLVSLGIYLLDYDADGEMGNARVAFTESQAEFFLPVFPGEKVLVHANRVYYRLGKLKCKVKMLNTKGDVVCKGTLSGMIIQ